MGRSRERELLFGDGAGWEEGGFVERMYLRSSCHVDRLDGGGVFCCLRSSTREQVRDAAVLYRFGDSEQISQSNFFDGSRIWLLLSGALHLVMRDVEGRTIVLLKITSENPQFAIPTECLCSLQYSAQIICRGDTELCCIPEELSTQIFNESRSVREWKTQCYVKTYARFLELINDLTFLPLKERLYKKLLEYCNLKQSDTITITHEQLAEELATSREVVSRILKKLETENAIRIKRKNIQLLAWNRGCSVENALY